LTPVGRFIEDEFAVQFRGCYRQPVGHREVLRNFDSVEELLSHILESKRVMAMLSEDVRA
jgi:hypothetical protein